MRSRTLNSCAFRVTWPAWKHKHKETRLRIRLCTGPPRRSIGKSDESTAQRCQERVGQRPLCTAKEIVCSRGAVQVCTKQLMSELLIMLSPERENLPICGPG